MIQEDTTLTRASVRKLDWVQETLGRRQKIASSWIADTPVGSYWIERKKKFWLHRPTPHGAGRAYYDTLEEAKAAGQEDFLSRINACLVDLPTLMAPPLPAAECVSSPSSERPPEESGPFGPNSTALVSTEGLFDRHLDEIRDHARRLQWQLTSDERPVPEHGWTCFHCSLTFKSWASASAHFGCDPIDGNAECRKDLTLSESEQDTARTSARNYLAIPDDVRDISERISLQYTDDRDLVRWVAALAITEDRKSKNRASSVATDVDVSRIREIEADAAAEGHAANWRSCSGCHETDEGVPHGDYSPVFQAHVGTGCVECGGLGVVWDVWTKESLDRMENEHASC